MSALAASQGIAGRCGIRIAEGRLVRADDDDDLRAMVGQHATGERRRADALELDRF